MEWHSKNIGNAAQAESATSSVMNAFATAFVAAGGGLDYAMFSRHDLPSNSIVLYFSPAATAFAKTVGASPCGAPGRDRLSLLVGDSRCWPLLFGTQGSK